MFQVGVSQLVGLKDTLAGVDQHARQALDLAIVAVGAAARARS